MLEDSFRLVDGIVADSSQLVDNVARDARRLASAAKGQPREPAAFVPADQGGTVARALLEAIRTAAREARATRSRARRASVEDIVESTGQFRSGRAGRE